MTICLFFKAHQLGLLDSEGLGESGMTASSSFLAWRFTIKSIYVSATPWKIRMEPENGGLEDDFPFQFWWFLGSMLIFRGVSVYPTMHINFQSGLKNEWSIFEPACLPFWKRKLCTSDEKTYEASKQSRKKV